MSGQPSATELEFQVLSFDHPELTARAVRSVLHHCLDCPVTLIHNGSRPENIQRLEQEFPAIIHEVLPENRGFSGGANHALKNQQAKWLMFLTNDCSLESVGQTPTKPGLFAPLIFRRQTQNVDSIGGLFCPQSLQLEHLKAVGAGSQESQPSTTFFYVPGTAFLIHRDLPKNGLLFDEGLGTYWEDVDYSVRAAQQGCAVGTAQEFVVRHGVGKTCHGKSLYTNYMFQRNRYRVCRRYGATHRAVIAAAGKRIFRQAFSGQLKKAHESLKAFLDA